MFKQSISSPSPTPCLTLLCFSAYLAACDSSTMKASADGAVQRDGGAADAEQAAVKLEGILIDDFEDGDSQTTFPDKSWFQYNDSSNGGKSVLTFTGAVAGGIAMNGAGYQSTRSLDISYTFDQGTSLYQPYLGFGVWFADRPTPFDASIYVGIAYTYRGGAHRAKIENFEVTDYDFFGMDVPASADWNTVIVPFTQIHQEGWGIKTAFNPKNVGNVSFQVKGATGGQGALSIDNLMFLTSLPNQDPDMTVMPATPPAENPIDSIVITNPAQAKALAFLNRGYNITNWLEQTRFAGFTYDEAYVGKLAAAGFKSLRLPIDLDLYVTATTGTGDTLDVTVHDDLFTVLDAFAVWTAKVGMSLTIDYHQYDKSLDKAKPDSIAQAVVLWGKVAAHFASNPRVDFFYELLNEPELSFDGTPPTQDEWTAMAERMVTAIRATDQTHMIIFGDVQWYGIGPLSARKPLSDGNVAYAFHTYEPFIFTHQGAAWANMSSTHDLPYPYSPDRWSPYFADLGFNLAMESWILAAAKNYYQTGNRAALRNQIVSAKRWAVTNNVPVICNEFGAYDQASRLEDRARYLTDVVSIFEELQIPWQQWFMIMDNAGTVIPEYRTAMHLGQ
jgi:endoglucanase